MDIFRSSKRNDCKNVKSAKIDTSKLEAWIDARLFDTQRACQLLEEAGLGPIYRFLDDLSDRITHETKLNTAACLENCHFDMAANGALSGV